MTLGIVTFLSSCKKDKNTDPIPSTPTSCVCDIYDEWYADYGWYSDSYMERFDEDDLEDLRVDDCDELEDLIYDELNDHDGDDDVVRCEED